MKNLITSFVALTSIMTTSIAGVLDVVPKYKTDKGIIEVSLRDNQGIQQVSFRYCKVKGNPSTCSFLGNGQVFYNLRDLEEQRFNEEGEIILSAAGDLLIGAGMFFGGLAAAAVAVGSGAAIGTTGVYLIGTAAASSGVIGAQLLDPLNPFEQYKQSETISKKVLADETVVVDESIETFAKRLDLVLKKI